MNYKEAQELIFLFTGHKSTLLFAYTKDDGSIEGQITTGNPLAPIVAVCSSKVCESNLMEAIETENVEVEDSPHINLFDTNMWGEHYSPIQIPHAA